VVRLHWLLAKPELISRYSLGEMGELTAGKTLAGSNSIKILRQFTMVSTILIRLVVAFAMTKHRVSRAYDASPPSDSQCSCNCGMYFDGSKVKGDSSSGIDDDVVSSETPADCRESVFFGFSVGAFGLVGVGGTVLLGVIEVKYGIGVSSLIGDDPRCSRGVE
jgi:hypothetical protein